MEFLKENIHKAAIDYARKNNNEIVDLLSESQIKTSKEEETEEKK